MPPRTNGAWQKSVDQKLNDLKDDHKELKAIVTESSQEMREKFHDLELEFVKMQTYAKSKAKNHSALYGGGGAALLYGAAEAIKAFL